MHREVRTVSDGQSVEDLKRDLAEAREQQAATAKLLRMISGSTIDAQRIFAEIATTAAHLCNADDAMIFQVDGEALRLVAHQGSIPLSKPVGQHTLPMTRENVTGRAVLDRQTIQVPDLQTLGDEYSEGTERARRLGYRTVLAVPLIRAGEAIGAVAIRRAEVRPFTDRQVQLLSTFADHAVIAIENTRLFEAEQASKRELTDALKYQTAISDVLNVMSRSKFNLQPVLDIIAEGAVRLCAAHQAAVFRYDSELMHLGALENVNFAPGREETWRALFPRPATPETAVGRCILEKATVIVTDVTADSRAVWAREMARTAGYKSVMAVPMLHEGRSVGAITVARKEAGPFLDAHVELLKIFADQAVIAIENTRLFEAEQASKRELTEALEQQTATADVLKVI